MIAWSNLGSNVLSKTRQHSPAEPSLRHASEEQVRLFLCALRIAAVRGCHRRHPLPRAHVKVCKNALDRRHGLGTLDSLVRRSDVSGQAAPRGRTIVPDESVPLHTPKGSLDDTDGWGAMALLVWSVASVCCSPDATRKTRTNRPPAAPQPKGGPLVRGAGAVEPQAQGDHDEGRQGPASAPGILESRTEAATPAWDTIQPKAKEYAQLATETGHATILPKGDKDSWSKLTLAFAESATELDKAAQAKDKDKTARSPRRSGQFVPCHAIAQHRHGARARRRRPPGGGLRRRRIPTGLRAGRRRPVLRRRAGPGGPPTK